MPTNDEKISKIVKKLHDEFSVSPILYIDLEALIYVKAQVSTAKEIFAELDKMIEELDDSFRMIGEITLDEEQYEALKKKYKVD